MQASTHSTLDRLYIAGHDILLEHGFVCNTDFSRDETRCAYLHRAALHDPARQQEVITTLTRAYQKEALDIATYFHPEAGSAEHQPLEKLVSGLEKLPGYEKLTKDLALLAELGAPVYDSKSLTVVNHWLEHTLAPNMVAWMRSEYPAPSKEEQAQIDARLESFRSAYREAETFAPEILKGFDKLSMPIILTASENHDISTARPGPEKPNTNAVTVHGNDNRYLDDMIVFKKFQADTIAEELTHATLRRSGFDQDPDLMHALREDVAVLQSHKSLVPLLRWYHDVDRSRSVYNLHPSLQDDTFKKLREPLVAELKTTADAARKAELTRQLQEIDKADSYVIPEALRPEQIRETLDMIRQMGSQHKDLLAGNLPEKLAGAPDVVAAITGKQGEAVVATLFPRTYPMLKAHLAAIAQDQVVFNPSVSKPDSGYASLPAVEAPAHQPPAHQTETAPRIAVHTAQVAVGNTLSIAAPATEIHAAAEARPAAVNPTPVNPPSFKPTLAEQAALLQLGQASHAPAPSPASGFTERLARQASAPSSSAAIAR